MRAIINGKRFDTDKAILIGEASGGGYSMRDFRYFDEALYKTPRSGKFFLAGEGGAMTRWAKSTGQNSWCGGEGILPLDEIEAREWAETHLTVEQIEAAGFDVEDA